MPTTKIQKLFFMFATVFLSVIFFVFYNISLISGGFSLNIIPLALREIPAEFIIAFLLQYLFVSKSAENLALSVVDPKKHNPSMLIIAITAFSICIMCPSMSFAATLLHNGFNENLLADWTRKMLLNLPFAIVIQFFVIGPFVRTVFRAVFNNSNRQGLES